VVQHEIDARARSQGGELFEEFQGLEEQVTGAIGPGALELQQDATVPGEPKTILGDRGAQQIAAELLENGFYVIYAPRRKCSWRRRGRLRTARPRRPAPWPGVDEPGFCPA
jgi:hypothetical protein